MIRHRKVIIDPSDRLALWRMKYAKEHGSKPERYTTPEGFDLKENKAYAEHDIFCTMVKAFIRNQTFDIHSTIHNYWRLAFRRSFPEEGGSLLQLCTMIRLKLLKRGFEKNDIENDPEKVIKVRFPEIIPHKFADFKINSQQSEDCMGKKKEEKPEKVDPKKKAGYTRDDADPADDKGKKDKGKKEKKAAFPDPEDMDEEELRDYIKGNDIDYEDDLGFEDKSEYKEASKKDIRKALAKYFEKKSKSKEKVGKPKKARDGDKAGQCRVLCAELLLKKKYTDKKISEMIEEEVGMPYSVKRVARIRDGINEGKRERLGIPAPKPPLEEIGGKKCKKGDDD